MINALTIDVEDYFHVTAFERAVKRDQWDAFPLRVGYNTGRILDVLDAHGVKGTFFVLGWVAQRLPRLVKAIHDRGHEIACHGFAHERITRMSREDFRSDIRRTKSLLEELCGKRVLGYRAPSFSITNATLWALDILIEEGFLYDSSVFPIRHDVYGIRDAPLRPHDVERPAGRIKEFPLSTVQFNLMAKTLRLPVAGGGYLRLFPLGLLKWSLRRINRVGGYPAVLYFHPWEIDPGQPRIKAGIKSRFRHYNNLEGTLGKVEALLSAFAFAPMAEVLGIA